MKKYLTTENVLFALYLLWAMSVVGLWIIGSFTFFQTSLVLIGVNIVFWLYIICDTLQGAIFDRLDDVMDLQVAIARGIYGRIVSGEGDEDD